MVSPAQSHQVFNDISVFASTHTPGFDMVNVHSLCATYLARDEIGLVIPEMVKVYLGMLLHGTKFIRK
jgi:hypothetical protein